LNIAEVKLRFAAGELAEVTPRAGIRIQPEINPDDPIREQALDDVEVGGQPGQVVAAVGVESRALKIKVI